jgi:hypothetical protein
VILYFYLYAYLYLKKLLLCLCLHTSIYPQTTYEEMKKGVETIRMVEVIARLYCCELRVHVVNSEFVSCVAIFMFWVTIANILLIMSNSLCHVLFLMFRSISLVCKHSHNDY